jgi:hypothetical protein
MKTALIGYTGFVGQNLLAQTSFDDVYHSKNISDIRGKSYQLLVCSGIPADMQLANRFPEQDKAQIQALLDILSSVQAEHFVLISTIAVYKQPVLCSDENSPLSAYETSLPYGANRLWAEQQIMSLFKHAYILRLPALFGIGLKKNLIYDLLNPEPTFFKPEAFETLCNHLSKPELSCLQSFYRLDASSQLYKKNADYVQNQDLRRVLSKHRATALQFTHPNSTYQFYHLANLKSDIDFALVQRIPVLNVSSPPILAKEIAQNLAQQELWNENAPLYQYDMRSAYASVQQPYRYSLTQTMQDLKTFFEHAS